MKALVTGFHMPYRLSPDSKYPWSGENTGPIEIPVLNIPLLVYPYESADAAPGGPGPLQRFAELRARGAATRGNLLSDPAPSRSRWAGARAGGDTGVRWAIGEEFQTAAVVKRDAPTAGEGPGGEPKVPIESLVCGAYLEMKDVGACHLLERNAKLARSLLVLKADGGVEALEEWRCLRVIRKALACGQRVMVPRDALAASFGTAILPASLLIPT